MSQPKLVYLDIGGRAEPVRLAFAAGNTKFEDVRLAREAFMEKKMEYPFGQLPALEVDGKVLTQSIAQMVYAAKVSKIEPESAWDQAKVLEVVLAVEDATQAIVKTIKTSDAAARKEGRQKLATEEFPKFFGGLEKIIGANKQSDSFCVGNSITVADMALASCMNWVQSGVLDDVDVSCLDSYKKCNKVQESVYANSGVKAYYATLKKEQLPKKMKQ